MKSAGPDGNEHQLPRPPCNPALLQARAPSAPLDARPFDWAPVPGWPLSSDAATTTTTAAPAVAEMSKDAAPAAPAATQ